MKSEIDQLIEILPPPKEVPNQIVDWDKLEKAVGLIYPNSYKEFIAVYGACCWFDDFVPLYSTANSDEEISDYLDTVKDNLLYLRRNMTDNQGNEWKKVPVYPTKNGLFPFMIDYSSGLYCWKTDSGDPDKWPIIYWFGGPYEILQNMTIAGMFLSYLKREPPMLKHWGDINDLPRKQFRLD